LEKINKSYFEVVTIRKAYKALCVDYIKMKIPKDYPLMSERKSLADLLRFFRSQGMDNDAARLRLMEVDQTVEISEAEARDSELRADAERVYGHAVDAGEADIGNLGVEDSDYGEIFRATRTSVLWPQMDDSKRSLGTLMEEYVATATERSLDGVSYDLQV